MKVLKVFIAGPLEESQKSGEEGFGEAVQEEDLGAEGQFQNHESGVQNQEPVTIGSQGCSKQLIVSTLVGVVVSGILVNKFIGDLLEARKQQRNDKELKKKNVVAITFGNEVTALGNYAINWKDSFVGLFASAQKEEFDAEPEFEEDFSDNDSAE
ncbi:hypothetical protein JKY79_02140 [Candidatus Babeliales bacterium]|nr:hypothetical protein [Candidatus Babeliales bacterium]